MKFDKNIPIPDKKADNGKNHSRNKYFFSDMKVGDSFLVETEKEYKALSSSAGTYKSKNIHTFNYTIKKIHGEGWRLWRIEVDEFNKLKED